MAELKSEELGEGKAVPNPEERVRVIPKNH